jgi:hypothetical protein
MEEGRKGNDREKEEEEEEEEEEPKKEGAAVGREDEKEARPLVEPDVETEAAEAERKAL